MNYMIKLIKIIIVTLYWTELIRDEHAPFDLAIKFREAIGYHYDDDGDLEYIESNYWTDLVQCPKCLSTWVAIFWLLFDNEFLLNTFTISYIVKTIYSRIL